MTDVLVERGDVFHDYGNSPGSIGRLCLVISVIRHAIIDTTPVVHVRVIVSNERRLIVITNVFHPITDLIVYKSMKTKRELGDV